MRKKKILLAFIPAILVGMLVTGCLEKGVEKKDSTSKTEETGQKSVIQMPKCEEMNESVKNEFIEANNIRNLCEKYGTLQIENTYIFMQENGEKSEPDIRTEQYRLGDDGIEYERVLDGEESYQNGDKVSYMKSSMVSQEGEIENYYVINYKSDAYMDMYGSEIYISLYTGDGFADQSGYKETSNGYELYEAYDYGDGTGYFVTYYANENKIVEKTESVAYIENAEKYIDNVGELKTGIETTIAPIEDFENGEITVTVIEQASGKQTQIKMPVGTEMYFDVQEDEIVTKDEVGTEMIGETRYDTYMTVNENVTLYIVESIMSPEEEMILDTEAVG